MGATKVRYRLVKPISFTASTLPDLPTRWHVMACPRVMSQQRVTYRLGTYWPACQSDCQACVVFRVCAEFVFQGVGVAWSVFFGGSDLGVKAVRQAISLAERASVPLTVYTQGDASVREAVRGENRGGGSGSNARPAGIPVAIL